MMDRRSFLNMLVGGVAASAAVRVWPFRVYSFPSQIKRPSLCTIHADYDGWAISHDDGKTWEPWDGPDLNGRISLPYGHWMVRSPYFTFDQMQVKKRIADVDTIIAAGFGIELPKGARVTGYELCLPPQKASDNFTRANEAPLDGWNTLPME
jgi:hypothetical protein